MWSETQEGEIEKFLQSFIFIKNEFCFAFIDLVFYYQLYKTPLPWRAWLVTLKELLPVGKQSSFSLIFGGHLGYFTLLFCPLANVTKPKKRIYIGLIFFVLISAASKIYQYTIYILNYLQVEVFKRADQDQLKEIFSQVRTEFFFIVLWWIYLANGP